MSMITAKNAAFDIGPESMIISNEKGKP